MCLLNTLMTEAVALGVAFVGDLFFLAGFHLDTVERIGGELFA